MLKKVVVGHVVNDLDYKSLSLIACLKYHLHDKMKQKNEFIGKVEKCLFW